MPNASTSGGLRGCGDRAIGRGCPGGRAPRPRQSRPGAVGSLSFCGRPDASLEDIAIRSNAAQGPRRVSPPSNAAAGGVPSPAVGAPALRLETSIRSALGTAGDSSPALRETSRHDGSGYGTPGCCPVTPRAKTSSSARQPLLPVFGAPMPIRRLRRRSTDPVRRRAALNCAAWTVSITPDSPVQPRLFRALRMPRNLYASSERHKKNLLSSPLAAALQVGFAPRHYRISPPPIAFREQRAEPIPQEAVVTGAQPRPSSHQGLAALVGRFDYVPARRGQKPRKCVSIAPASPARRPNRSAGVGLSHGVASNARANNSADGLK